MQKICDKHGLTEYSEGKRPRCRKCVVIAVNKRRKLLKTLAIEHKGGKCEKCGYDKCPGALQFHHLNPSTKSFGISTSGTTKSWKRIMEELNKCIMLCANCHAEVHYNNFQLN